MKFWQKHNENKEIEAVNILFGPPSKRETENEMLSLFFSEEGMHIVCGGTTSTIVSKFLGKPLKVSLDYIKDDIPPIAYIEGVDLVTEGIITMKRVNQYAKDYIGERALCDEWQEKNDGASLIWRVVENAKTVRLFVGTAENSAHKHSQGEISFDMKMKLISELLDSLEKMGKQIFVNYF